MIEFSKILRDAGLPVHEVSGWRSRGRPPSGNPGDPAFPAATKFAGIGLHHTAGHHDLDVVVGGRPGIPGPLANLYVSRDGRVHVVAAGRANHFGPGAREVYQRTLRDQAPLGDAATLGLHDSIVGNGVYVGIEVENYGTAADPYPQVQIQHLERACAAICKHQHWTANRCVQHREWTRRKLDMSYRGPLRQAVAALLSGEDIILDAATKAYFDKQFELVRVGDRPGGSKDDTHDFSSIEGVRRRVDELSALVELLRTGDVGEPETHPQNLDTIYKQNEAMQSDLTTIKEELAAIRQLLEQRSG
ncbi:MAG TPA: N-acetylmuramoyl-L-alanine amidase [Actinomycetes bacterium]